MWNFICSVYNCSSLVRDVCPYLFHVCVPGFWNSALCNQGHCLRRPLSRTLSPQRNRRGDPGSRHRCAEAHSDSAPPTLRSDSSGSFFRLERRHSSGPLCFLNPLFIQTHHRPRQHHCERHLSSYAGNSENGTGERPEAATELSSSRQEGEGLEDGIKLNRKLRLPPPRPPPPRLMPRRRPAPPPPLPTATATGPKSVPEAAVPAKPLKSSKRRPAPQPPKGARPSGASKVSTSPVATPSNLPPPTPKNLDLEAHRCHIAMEDDTIAEALSRAKLPSCRPPPADGGEHTDPLSVPARGRQRLSDTSMSSSSSDSLDYSPSPGFSFGLTSSRSQHLNHQVAVEDSSEDDENDDEDEEVDYGVGLETDLEMRLRQSSKAQRKRISVSLGGGPFILPRALKGRFQKVSGMLSSLVTPERRIIKKITELSHDRSSYFGSLVQDYISFVQENRGCHTSGTDFLQTLRQFMTQMKAYLCQSSELDPPLESLIPEDQIGKWATSQFCVC